jgi:cytochrome P450
MSVVYDPRAATVTADPSSVFRQLREHDPVHWSEVLRGWVLTRYDDVRSALRDARFSADRITPFVRHMARTGRGDIQSFGETLSLWPVFRDPPDHTRLRGLMNKGFTPRMVESMRPRIQAIVDALLDAIRDRRAGRFDLIAAFAFPLPAMVMGTMLGLEIDRLEEVKQWSDDLATFVGTAQATPDKYERARRGLNHLVDYFRDSVGRRRAQGPHRPAPGAPDVIGALIAAEEDGARLTEMELIATCIFLLFAGHETTANLIGSGLWLLLSHPAQLARLRAEPALVRSAVEEVLRYEGPSGAAVRIAAQDMTLGGKSIKRGDRIFAMINAADRDPAVFAAPERFDVARDDTRHLAFGLGMHFCIGAPLARLEGQIAFETLLRRLPNMALDLAAPEWSDSLILRGIKSIPIAYDTIAAA